MYKAENAIIMAAGSGSRLSPITDTIPKHLIKVQGKPIIESMIDSLIYNNIKEIVIVVGHFKEQFEYLPEKYQQVNIALIENPYYETCNNISSLYIARKYLGNSIITDGDIIVNNHKILDPYFEESGYCSSWTTETKEWLQQVDKDDYVKSCSRIGGKNGWLLYSISFWNQKDSSKLSMHLEELFEKRKVTDIFWDDIPVFYYKEEYKLKIRRIDDGDLDEVDDLDDLYDLL